ncbi:malectin domain-containing carbohydrate-binding protein, partial [Thermogemmatispora sp.]|uniref:malectin domain-containing carbohydrate-binding protein n=1 Tax=Thermogemmatispora sp. TaxID=1968838 RepID=UPI002ACC2A87
MQINAGGPAVTPFVADAYYSGGSTASTSNAIDTSGVTNPAPQAVYQSNRYGNFTYTIPNLTAGAAYTVRLHFAETYWSAAGKRVFNVSINGQQVLTNFDIYAAAGG